AAGGPLGLRKRGVEAGVYVKADATGFPLDGVEVKVSGEVLAGGKAEGRAGVTCLGDGAGAVERSMDRAGLLAYVFHDVDFAALGPANGTDVIPSIQKAGHIPCPAGILMRASKRPKAWLKRP